MEYLLKVGDSPTTQGIEVMREYGVNLSNHKATNIKESNIEQMDLILCATTAHKTNVINMYPNLRQKIYTMKEYVGYEKNNLDLEDPWGQGIDKYKKCAKEIDEILKLLVEELKKR